MGSTVGLEADRPSLEANTDRPAFLDEIVQQAFADEDARDQDEDPEAHCINREQGGTAIGENM